MARYGGRNGLVYMGSTGTGVATSVIGLTQWSIDMSQDMIEVTGFGDSNKQYVPGLRDAKGSFSGTWDDTETKIYAAANSADGTKIYLYPSSSKLASYFYGPAWVTFSMSVDSGGKVSVSGNWSANGAWDAKSI